MIVFQDLSEIPTKQIWDGVMARIVQSELITMAIVELAPGSVVPEHHHKNEQLGFVLEGAVTFTVGNETRQFGRGGTWRIVSDVPHSVEVGPEGAVVAEVYSPIRSDWDKIDAQELQPPRWPSDD